MPRLPAAPEVVKKPIDAVAELHAPPGSTAHVSKSGTVDLQTVVPHKLVGRCAISAHGARHTGRRGRRRGGRGGRRAVWG